ncbi:polysaccharide deacetylase family protein [Nibricoccus sp. IMCC34717]|uniref:polysaccharide deacetylase family protein n=1 Tax=Nibricoccus sp. IMCC34717 TaxID=3034021 RepID=UPI00384D2675
MAIRVALKVDVDTERGTREGVPALVELLRARGIPACFLFSLGPDNTGKAIRRIFRPGFFSKVSRTSVVQIYGIRTLMNGTLLPAPHIGRRHEGILRAVYEAGFEVGIHCHDHFRWQDYVTTLPLAQVREEFDAARAEFRRIFGFEAKTAGAPGWQTCPNGRTVYDEAGLLYSSDSRGTHPFFPRMGGVVGQTPEFPSTLPTFDELMGRPEYPDSVIPAHYAKLLSAEQPNVFTIHAELEGMAKRALFIDVLDAMTARSATFVRLDNLAREALAEPARIPVNDLVMAPIDGRSGLVATQVRAVT